MASLLAATAAASPSPSPAPDLARVQPQAGIIDGSNPTKYNPKDPIILFIIQVCGITIHYPRPISLPFPSSGRRRLLASDPCNPVVDLMDG